MQGFGAGVHFEKLPEFFVAQLRELAVPDVVGCQLVLFLGAGFAHEDGNFVAREFAAEFSFAGGDGAVALGGPLGKSFEQIRGDSRQFEAVLAALDGVAQVPDFAGERVAINFGEIACAFKDVRRFEGEQPRV